jgi:hypothetical protein
MLKFHLGCDDTLCSGGKQCWARQFNCTPAALCPPNMPLCVVLPNLWMTNILPGRSLPGSFRSASQRDSLWTDLPGCWKTFELHRWYVHGLRVQMQTGLYRQIFICLLHIKNINYRDSTAIQTASALRRRNVLNDRMLDWLIGWLINWWEKNGQIQRNGKSTKDIQC